MVKVKLFIAPRFYGAAADVVVAKTPTAAGAKIKLSQNIGLALDDDVAFFTRVAGGADITAFDEPNCRGAARTRVLSQLGAAFDVGVKALDLDGIHIWVPRFGWVDQGAGNAKLFAFPLLDARTTPPPGAPYVDTHTVKLAAGGNQMLQLDYLVVVQMI